MTDKPTYEELEKRVIELEKAESERKKQNKITRDIFFDESLPLVSPDDVDFGNLFNLEEIQKLQDEFASATGVASIITHKDGSPITRPSNFCRLCRDIVRKTAKGLSNCYRSDAIIGGLSPDGPTIQPCMSGGLWDAGAAISVGGRHIANWLIGQVRDDTQTEEKMRSYAREIGADESEVLAAFREVPIMPIKRFKQIAKMLFTLANQLSKIAYHNLQLRLFIQERKEAESALKISEAYLRTLVNTIPDLIWMKSSKGAYLLCNSRFEKFFGAKEKEIIGKTDYDFVDKELADFFRKHDKLAIAKGGPSKNEEEVTFAEDGHHEFLETIKTPIYDDEDKLVGVLGIGRDITEWKNAERDRIANLNFFESLDKVNLAIHGTNDFENMLRNVLDVALTIFSCDRAHLFYPCDPLSETWWVPMERTRPEYPGAFQLNTEIATTPFMRKTLKNLLEAQAPLTLRIETDVDIEEQTFKQFGIKSILIITLYPKIGKPWVFGLQQCSYQREWTTEEKKLFQEIGRRLADGLTSMLVMRDLKQSEESYRAIWENAPYPILIQRMSDHVFLQVNEAAVRYFGWAKEKFIGHKRSDLNIIVDPSDSEQILDSLRSQGFVKNMQIRHRNEVGHSFENLVSIQPFRFQGEDCFISMFVDITEQKKTLRALEESEARFRIIFETAADPIFLNDMETGRFLDVNRAACRHLGYEKEAFLKMKISDINKDDAVDYRAYFSKHKDKGESFFFESRHVRKNGTIADVEINSQQMQHQNRKVLLSIVRDITPRKQIEAELAQYRANLEKMVRERTDQLKTAQNELVKNEKLAVLGQLTATVSHELRNPLGVIRSSNFFLQRRFKSEDEKTKKHFKRIDDQVTLCDTIVADMLEYTRGRKTNMSLKELSPWLSEVIEQIKEQEEGLEIDIKIPDNLPPVLHDPDKMRRVMINLLTNSVQAIHTKMDDAVKTSLNFVPRIEVQVGLSDDRLVINICDNGTGMSSETLQRAFEPLFTTRARGTGLGLAIVKKIIDQHKGTLFVKSNTEKGTRVSLALPCCIPERNI